MVGAVAIGTVEFVAGIVGNVAVVVVGVVRVFVAVLLQWEWS